ncbi:MAG TPA: hypothetical protein VH540_12110 [Ktedonobacterales bacterium]|jgi:WD40 repeat protein
MRQRIVPFLTFLSVLLLAGCSLTPDTGPTTNGPAAPTNPPAATSAPAPPPQTLAYIGSDNNVWVMTWPNGTPKQLTNDSVPTNRYTWLAWSPDGSLLAAEKTTPAIDVNFLVIMQPDGKVVVNMPLPGGSAYDLPFAWSPDSTMLAFRGFPVGNLPDGTATGTLYIFDAHTGKKQKTITFTAGGSGCGGAGPFDALTQEMWTVHHTSWEVYSGDTFAWSPDQHSNLVSNSCSQAGAAQVDLSTGVTDLPYPYDGGYQPGGNMILGYWHDGTLGLTDLSAKHVRALVKPGAYDASYMLGMGQSVWASDSQSVYYEHDDSIWQVGVDGSNPHLIVAGTALDSQQNATLQLVPAPSPDGKLLLYLQVKGSNREVNSDDPAPQPTPTIPLTTQWYVAQADGSNPVALPQGVQEAVWQPVP